MTNTGFWVNHAYVDHSTNLCKKCSLAPKRFLEKFFGNLLYFNELSPMVQSEFEGLT